MTLAIQGGAPVRASHIPYGRQSLNDEDIQAVVSVLKSDWLTTGPTVQAFERAIAEFSGMPEAIAVSNGTAALHAAMHAAGIGPGDEVIVPPLTFAATANAVVFQGARPVFADVEAESLLLDPESVLRHLSPRTKAIVAVDYAGHPCDYETLRSIADECGLRLIADACHSLGASYRGRTVGTLADMTAFSFHPVKPITTAEGGMVVTHDARFATRMRHFRNHGITTEHRERTERGRFAYEMTDLGFNYRLSDLQCALGLSQLRRLPEFLERRRTLAMRYDRDLAQIPGVRPLKVQPDIIHAYHLYVVQLDLAQLKADRQEIFEALRAEGIGANVHYLPVHLHPYYRTTFGTDAGLCPVAESAYPTLLSLPIFPQMTDRDLDDVVVAMEKVLSHYRK